MVNYGQGPPVAWTTVYGWKLQQPQASSATPFSQLDSDEIPTSFHEGGGPRQQQPEERRGKKDNRNRAKSRFATHLGDLLRIPKRETSFENCVCVSQTVVEYCADRCSSLQYGVLGTKVPILTL